MGSLDDKGCYSPRTNSYNLELSKANHTTKNVSNGRKALNSRSKPTPSKWDDAQKWLVGLSGVGDNKHHSKAKPRNSNAEDRRLLPPMPQKGRDSCSSIDGGLEEDLVLSIPIPNQEGGETKKIDCSDQSVWRTNRPVEEAIIGVRSVSLRDMGTEMTPIASKEPSRTGTPLRARSPINSRASSPGRSWLGGQHVECYQTEVKNTERKNRVDGDQSCSSNIVECNGNGFVRKSSSLESRAMAWDEAERTKYMARYKREEVKIQARENRETRKAELQVKRLEIHLSSEGQTLKKEVGNYGVRRKLVIREITSSRQAMVKAERMKSRAQEKLANKIASTRRRAEEKRSSAEAKLSEQAAKTSERAGYIRRAGHLPSSFFSFKLPSLCG